MIDKLSDEQIKKMDEYVETYTKIGLNTDRFTRKYAEGIIHNFQRDILNVKETPVMVFDNPRECNMALKIIACMEECSGGRLKEWEKIWKKLESVAYNGEWADVDAAFKKELWAEVSAGTPKVSGGIYPYQDGSFFAAIFSYYDFFEKELGLDFSDYNYSSWRETVNLGLIYPLDNVCIVSQKPSVINLDDQNRLHCEDGPALSYVGGFDIYSINGVRVDEYVVANPEKITIDDIKNEKNQEVKRIKVERYGTDRYLAETGSVTIDFDIRGIAGGGARALIRENNGDQWLVVTDGSTERVYYLYVNRNVKTCKEAHEELCGFSEEKVKMEG